MQLEAPQYVSDLFSTKKTTEPHFAVNEFERTEQHFNPSCSQLVDIHSKYGVRICYFRVTSGEPTTKVCVSTGTVSHAVEGSEFGVLLRVNYEEHQYTVWLPSAPTHFGTPTTQHYPTERFVMLPSSPEMICFDQHKRITTASSASLASYQWQFQPSVQLIASPSSRESEVTVFPYIILEDPDGQLFKEISSLNDVEQRLYRKGTWFFPRKPADIWNYLIDGSLYDPRFRKGVNKRFKCQQCAYAWWNYLNFLHKQTNKKIYRIMQDEVAYSVLLDMSDNGEWGHGFWSNDIETHSRFHLDGIHLLISQYEKTQESIWLEAAKRGMAFLAKHLVEKLDDGNIWFLHDTIEHSLWKSKFFGKSPSNSLCINTHIQALTVLHRLDAIAPEEKVYAEMFESGVKALQKLLDYQPAEILYRPLMFWVLKYKTGKKNSKLDKIKDHLQMPFILFFYWSVRYLFPRIVQSNGFIDRDISASFAPDGYHVINLKDLLILYKQKPLDWLSPYITNGVNLVRKFDLNDALERNLQYVELIDTLYMYNELIEPIPSEELESVEQKILQKTGGYSVDYYASELVQSFGN